MKTLLLRLVLWAAVRLIRRIKPQDIERVGDFLLDIVENLVENSPNKFDDQSVIPLCQKIRETFGIENHD